ncbi:hypothetical protein D778_01846 [Xanthomarina gelatinilytica]|uniref:Uncharacterized protein n=1 Tax=Xanthomarina gelatinilytica TaxID=1137281 RepID=M7MLI4_9FLAO|nr:hypothetical protein D778_01846 [Xanthomarina gelatinilytica]
MKKGEFELPTHNPQPTTHNPQPTTQNTTTPGSPLQVKR